MWESPDGSDSTYGSYVARWGGFWISDSGPLAFKKRREELGYEEAQGNLWTALGTYR